VRVWVKDTVIYIDREQYGIETEINELHYLIDKLDDKIKQSVMRCDSARPETISYLKNNGYPLAQGVKKWSGSVEDGIAFMRSFEIVIHPLCKNLIEEFSKYSYKVDKHSGDVTSIIVDKWNHGIDAVRYALGGLITNKKSGILSTMS
jgi:phage terminase large subunit